MLLVDVPSWASKLLTLPLDRCAPPNKCDTDDEDNKLLTCGEDNNADTDGDDTNAATDDDTDGEFNNADTLLLLNKS